MTDFLAAASRGMAFLFDIEAARMVVSLGLLAVGVACWGLWALAGVVCRWIDRLPLERDR